MLLPENVASMTGGMGTGGFQFTQWGRALEAWLPTGPDGKGQLQATGGFCAAWRLETCARVAPPPGREELGRGSHRQLGSPQAGPRGASNHFRRFGFKHTHCETAGPKPAFRGLPFPASGLGRQYLPHTSILVI